MARLTKDTSAKLYRRSVSIKEAHRAYLALIDPNNESVAIRYLMQWAINHGALAPFLNPDGTPKPPPKSEKGAAARRLAGLKPDPFAGWEDDTPAQVATPAQPTTQAAVAGYKPATDADMRAMMQDIEQSLK